MTNISKGSIDDRKYERKAVRVPALLYRHGRFHRVKIVNVSQGGVGIEGAFGLMRRDAVKIELIDGRMLLATVAWVVGSRVGLAFNAALGVDDVLLDADSASQMIAKMLKHPRMRQKRSVVAMRSAA